jgi:hypothetical protein
LPDQKLLALCGLLALAASGAFAQDQPASQPSAQPAEQPANLSSYQGPGVVSRGAGEVGYNSGKQLDLRVFGGASFIFDNSLQPLALDSSGHLVPIDNLYGAELTFGAYGVHRWRRAQLGLDYRGDVRRYANSDQFNGSDHNLTLGYTYQSSRRLFFDLRQTAGTVTTGTSWVTASPGSDASGLFTPATVFFDNRTSFLQSTASATYLLTPRTSVSATGDTFLMHWNAPGFTNSWGYDFTGSIARRMTRNVSIGGNYVYSHYEFPGFGGTLDANGFHGTYAQGFGRFWTLSLAAGLTITEQTTPFTLALPPELAALFNQATVSGIAYSRNVFPDGSATLERRFRNASVFANYSRGLSPGNGALAGSRQTTIRGGLSYTGIRKWNFGADGGQYVLVGFSQFAQRYVTYSAGGGVTYNLGRSLFASARYDLHQYQFNDQGYVRTGSRLALSLLFSPGTIPLSLW